MARFDVVLREITRRVTQTNDALSTLGAAHPPVAASGPRNDEGVLSGNAIYCALLKFSPELANSYGQVMRDVQDRERTSWAGTAHELREILARALRELAPDDKVRGQSWYTQEPGTAGPTHRQRARYVMEQQKAGSRETELAEEVGGLEEQIGLLVRATYTRASDAAHRTKQRREVVRIVRYFEAFMMDLLNIEDEI